MTNTGTIRANRGGRDLPTRFHRRWLRVTPRVHHRDGAMDFRLKGPKGQATLRKVPPERPLEEFLQELGASDSGRRMVFGEPGRAVKAGFG